jgi:serine phosphatase RsbU (regulator of sigma subunit)
MPTATAVRESRTMHYADRAQFDADHPVQSQNLLRALDLHTVVAVPLPGGQGPRGAIVLGWDRHRALDAMDLLAVTTIAGYAAHAITRAELQQHRIDVVHQLQQAMLTELPAVHGLRMAAHYRPADSRDQVGGDWYDAAALPDPAHPGHPLLAVTVGDIIGHDVDAATIMGQTRSMIRQAGWDHPGASPTQTLAAFENANAGLQLGAAGTLVLAHLRPPGPDTGTWLMTWTNAGHPPPVVVRADGTTVLLDAHDALFGLAALRDSPRHDHYTDLEPGSTLFLYTDGLIERRCQDLDTGLENLRALLTDHHEGSLQSLVETAVDTLAPDATDDVIAFAIHLPAVT